VPALDRGAEPGTKTSLLVEVEARLRRDCPIELGPTDDAEVEEDLAPRCPLCEVPGGTLRMASPPVKRESLVRANDRESGRTARHPTTSVPR
jgi:hypothetical protein